MLVGSTAWASGTTPASPTAGTSQPQPARVGNGCISQVILFNAVMQPAESGCVAPPQSRTDNRHAPQSVHRARSGQLLLRPDANVRYSF